MTPEQLMPAIRAALDAQVRHVESVRDFIPDAHQGEFIDPAAVLRRVAADRELLQAYEEQRAWMEPHYSDDQYNGGLYEGLLTAVRALARGLGINPEETP